jgi:hypothetical protein
VGYRLVQDNWVDNGYCNSGMSYGCVRDHELENDKTVDYDDFLVVNDGLEEKNDGLEEKNDEF